MQADQNTPVKLDLFSPVALPDPDGIAPEAATPPTKLICLTTVYGDTLWAIARLFGLEAEDIARMNAIADPDRIFPGRRLYLRVPASVPIAPCADYTVRPGDTLTGIARRLGLSAKELAADNDLTNPDLIKPGQRLVIG